MPANRLLVLDDDPSVLQFIAEVGRQGRYQVEVVASPQQFHEVYDAFAPTLIFLDLRYEEGDGIEMMTVLKQLNCQVPIALISGFEPRVIDAARRVGISLGLNVIEGVTKPISPTSLERILEVHRQPELDEWADELRRGVEHDEFTVFYQPKVDTDSGRVLSFEALARWQHPFRGMVGPDEFIPLAESTGLIGPLTDRVLAHAVADCSQWTAAGHNLSVAVNLSPSSLTREGLLARLLHVLAGHGMPSSRLTLEVTETTAMQHSTVTTAILSQLRLRGFTLALDDFGTGFSNLALLHSMPFNELKIDKGFIVDVTRNGDSQVIVRALISLARHLGLTTVAEGVEDLDTWEWLRSLEVEQIQGFVIARPMPATHVLDWMGGYAVPALFKRRHAVGTLYDEPAARLDPPPVRPPPDALPPLAAIIGDGLPIPDALGEIQPDREVRADQAASGPAAFRGRLRFFGMLALLGPMFIVLQALAQAPLHQIEERLFSREVRVEVPVDVFVDRVVYNVVYVPMPGALPRFGHGSVWNLPWYFESPSPSVEQAGTPGAALPETVQLGPEAAEILVGSGTPVVVSPVAEVAPEEIPEAPGVATLPDPAAPGLLDVSDVLATGAAPSVVSSESASARVADLAGGSPAGETAASTAPAASVVDPAAEFVAALPPPEPGQEVVIVVVAPDPPVAVAAVAEAEAVPPAASVSLQASVPAVVSAQTNSVAVPSVPAVAIPVPPAPVGNKVPAETEILGASIGPLPGDTARGGVHVTHAPAPHPEAQTVSAGVTVAGPEQTRSFVAAGVSTSETGTSSSVDVETGPVTVNAAASSASEASVTVDAGSTSASVTVPDAPQTAVSVDTGSSNASVSVDASSNTVSVSVDSGSNNASVSADTGSVNVSVSVDSGDNAGNSGNSNGGSASVNVGGIGISLP